MINSKEISVIVQGPIYKKETPKCLKSIRKYLPDAEIILSTWEGADIDGLDFDVLVENKDPGTVLIDTYKSKKIYNNINRQLLSTQEGLKKANRKYVLKLRSDLILTGINFLKYFDEYQARGENYNLFEHKVLIPILFTRYKLKLCGCHKRYEMPFHISDWWFFGLRSDIETYFADTSLVLEPEFTLHFSLDEHKQKDNPYCRAKHKFAPEQYYCYSCFNRKFKDIYMEDASDSSPELMQKFKECLLNNFIILDFSQSGIYLNKYSFSKFEKFIGDQYIDLYNQYRFQKDYKEICDNNFEIIAKPILEDKKTYALMRIYKHIYKLIDPNTKFLKRFEELIFAIPISISNYMAVLIRQGRYNVNKNNKTN